MQGLGTREARPNATKSKTNYVPEVASAGHQLHKAGCQQVREPRPLQVWSASGTTYADMAILPYFYLVA